MTCNTSNYENAKTYPWVHKNKVHLHKSEDHLKDRIDPTQNHVTRRSEWHFEKRPKLQPVIDHRTQPECWKQIIKTISCKPLPIHSPIAPIRRKKLPWLWSFWVVFRFFLHLLTVPAYTSVLFAAAAGAGAGRAAGCGVLGCGTGKAGAVCSCETTGASDCALISATGTGTAAKPASTTPSELRRYVLYPLKTK